MIHGLCDKQNMNSPCMDSKTKKCTKNFPKAFNEQTNFNSNGYPNYPRSNDGKQISFSKQKKADNKFVVPYNPYLLLKFNIVILM